MSKTMETAQSYWDARSELFGNYYQKPSAFDLIFRKGVYERQAVAVKACQEIPQAKVLDVGSGPGFNSVSLLKNAKASHVVGIDFAPQMVEYAQALSVKENVAKQCDFLLGDILTHEFNGQMFDYVYALGVFDYVKDAQSLLSKMVSLSSNAVMASWPEDGLRMSLRRYRYTCPLFDYTAGSILQLHENVGVSKDKVDVIRIGGGWATVARK